VKRIVRAFPVLPGMETELRAFADELMAQPQDLAEFYGVYGIATSSWHLQETANGRLLIVITEVVMAEPYARSYATSERRFDRWFKDMVMRISGVNPDSNPLGPKAETVFEWRGDGPEG
jgi:hypothetical protein